MSKYTNEFKFEVVNAYLGGKYGGFESVSKHYNIPSKSIVKKWVGKYNEHGATGLIKNYQKYNGYFKINVVEYMHNNHLSLQETAIHFNIAGAEIVGKWERIYYEEGPQALYEERRGRKRNMDSKLIKKNLSNQTEKDLISENQQLRMEVAYLKKLNALVQERVKRENQRKHKPSQN